MKIVLLERVSKLGQMGDIVKVKSGYARNFLLPFKKALRATPQNIKYFEDKKTELETKNIENKKEADNIKSKLDGKVFILIRSASDTGALYGSVSSKDINEISSKEGIDISKNQINLEKPIKELGIYNIKVTLHPDIISEIIVNVARTQEEAKAQQTGKHLTDINNKDIEKNLELKNLFDDEQEASKIEDATLENKDNETLDAKSDEIGVETTSDDINVKNIDDVEEDQKS